MRLLPVVLPLLAALTAPAAERVNHAGRVLGPLPAVTAPILFDTAQADSVVSAMQILPVDNPWNEDVSHLPPLANSDAMIAQITADLAANRRTLRPFYEMNYVLAPDAQPLVSLPFFNYPAESDLNGGVSPNALYPIPANLPIEGWPQSTGTLTLDQWQQDVNNTGGDRHAIMVVPGAGLLWETWLTKRSGTDWQASNGAGFNLNSNALRPAGWTSGDAAGLPMFPALVRWDECQRGMVEHALRLVVKRTRASYLYPATHMASAGNTTDPNIPAMGQRVRLKAGFVIPASWTLEEKAVLLALKKYGALVADNGGFFSVSVCPDERFSGAAFAHLSSIAISNFEVVQATGPTGGPRSAGRPAVSAGLDQTIDFGATAALAGQITGSTAASVSWKVGAGTGAVTFANPGQAQTTATFSLPGQYVLVLGAADDVHGTVYSAVAVDVVLKTAVRASPPDCIVSFPTLTGHDYSVERTDDLAAVTWGMLAGNLPGSGGLQEVADANALSFPHRFYRVRVLR